MHELANIAYVANSGGNTVSVIDGKTYTIRLPVEIQLLKPHITDLI